jgi:hypothetical protein
MNVHFPLCRDERSELLAKPGICTKVLGEINTSCGEKYSLENSHSTAIKKIENSPAILETRGGTKALRFRNLAPCRVTDSSGGHCIVLKHRKTHHSRCSDVTRPK